MIDVARQVPLTWRARSGSMLAFLSVATAALRERPPSSVEYFNLVWLRSAPAGSAALVAAPPLFPHDPNPLLRVPAT